MDKLNINKILNRQDQEFEIKSILKDKITPKHLENFIKHSYKIYD